MSLLQISIILAGLSSQLPGSTSKILATLMGPRVIETQYGKLRGVLVTLTNRNLGQVETHLGLQYASVWSGDLRFMPATSAIEKWDGIRVALKNRPVCPQKLPSLDELEAHMPKSKVQHFKRLFTFLDEQQEDCLHLNIYVPARDRSDTSLLPVVVFIHGESFNIGTGNAYDGSALAAYGHVIVVTINYRLGVLGFLSTGDSSAPGNYAILDVIAALRWIQENIRPFGGSKTEVTLLAHSYGAVLANLLMVSPITKGRNLFQRVILQSGSALFPFAMVINPMETTLRLADRVNCTTGSVGEAEVPSPASLQTILQCLKHLPLDQLIDQAHAIETSLGALPRTPSFGPTIDRRSVLLTDIRSSLAEVTSDSVFGNVTLMVGFTSQEVGAFFNDSVHDRGITMEAMRDTTATLIGSTYSHHHQAIHEVLMHQYRDWEGSLDDVSVWRRLADLLGDALYAVPAFETGLHHAAFDASKTFLYCFNFTTGGGRADSTAAKGAESAAWHGDDLTYIFGAPLTDGLDPFPAVYTKAEKTFAEAILKFWINFIKTGSPNDATPALQQGQMLANAAAAGARLKGRPPDAVSAEWPEFDAERQEVMILDSRSHSRRQFRASRLALWLSLIPKIHRPDDPELCGGADDSLHPPSNADPRPPSANLSHHHHHRPFCSTRGTTTTVVQRTPSPRGRDAPSSGTGPHHHQQRIPTVFPQPAAITAHRRSPPAGEPSAERRGLKTTPMQQLETQLRGTNFHAATPLPGTIATREVEPHGHELKQAEPASQEETSLRSPAGGSDQGLALVVVVGVGCFLLALNVLLFLCVYRKQLWRWRERRKRRKSDLGEAEEKGELTEQSYAVKGDAVATGRAIANGPETDRCSHYLTPIPSHHHLYCPLTSLQNSIHAPS